MKMELMARITENAQTSLRQRLEQRRTDRWPQLTRIGQRFRGDFAYIDAETSEGESWQVCRLRYTGSLDWWGFAIYLASRDGYEPSILPTGLPTGTPEDALDCACGLYLAS